MSGEGGTDHPPPTTAAPPSEPATAEEWLTARREALKESADARRVPSIQELPIGSLGLALSGGGIRSATLSLGLVQALSRNDRLFDFDYVSTVSGGGYFGSFLSGLFVPPSMRGAASQRFPDPAAAERAELPLGELGPKARRAFVENIFRTDSNEDQVDVPQDRAPSPGSPAVKMRNPIWWLREHGRYLAPNGPTDYMYAIAFITRNWVAMIYTFMIAALNIFFALTLVSWVAVDQFAPGLANILQWSPPGAKAAFTLSPILIVPVAALFLATASGIAYWLTSSLDTTSRWSNHKQLRPSARFLLQACGIAAATLALTLLARYSYGGIPAFRFWDNGPDWLAVALGVDLILTGFLLAMLAALVTWRKSSGDVFTVELRRRITRVNAAAINVMLWGLALAVIDTIALSLSPMLADVLGKHRWPSTLPVALAPVVAWLFSKLPQWFGGGKLSRLLGEHLWTVALIAGALAFALLAITADAIVQLIVWHGSPASVGVPGQLEACNCAIILRYFAIFLLLGLVTGLSSGFVNLSSLHSFYAGRLTRAYIGASNLRRLVDALKPGEKALVTDNHPDDYIDLSCYRARDSIAPIHLINVTLNETRSRGQSQLTDRDRKGVPVVFAPEGVLLNAGRQTEACLVTWKEVRENSNVDALSVGQACAISGAAASAGMGSQTTLGGALAMTFANIRLGYWWVVDGLFAKRLGIESSNPLLGKGLLATYYYFFNEMTARYSLADHRVYLSDGGHFENSGAYELLRRGVKVIVVGDFAQDTGYNFADLENLVRKARIDLGLAINLASRDAAASLLGRESESLFLNRFGDDWRAHVRATDTGAALLFEVRRRSTEPVEDPADWAPIGHIIWLKPKLLAEAPEDIQSYATAHPNYPQETTGDQFFDEAQWESYRVMGYILGQRLMTGTFPGRNVLRSAARQTAQAATPPA